MAFILLWLWERRNLAGWRRGERVAFWVFWTAALVWALALEAHVAVPRLDDLTPAFRPLWREFLRERPDIYW